MAIIPPILALVGRPNVGKSTLFNRLTRSRDALVTDLPGTTRDRIYGEGHFEDQAFLVIDTGGLSEKAKGLEILMTSQTEQALKEADHLLFIVDGRAGLTATDQTLAKRLRKLNKSLTLVVNKIDGVSEKNLSEFHSLGLGKPYPISAAHGRGIQPLMEAVLPHPTTSANQVELDVPECSNEEKTEAPISIAIVGRPNVGKSTLINRLLGKERMVVFDVPGTTRDSIYLPLERRGKHYVLIDTAGVRRRGRIRETIEKFSVVKTLQAIESAQVIILVIDAQEGITEQDLHLLGFVIETGKALIIAVNKWDGLNSEARKEVKEGLTRRLTFVHFALLKFISALHGTGVGDLFGLINQCYESAGREVATSELTRLLEEAVSTHQPPLVKGRRVKLRYAHLGGHHPLTIVIHGKQTKALPESYRRYLSTFFAKCLKIKGTPIRIVFRSDENPYL